MRLKYLSFGLSLVVGTVITIDGMIRLPYILEIPNFWNHSKLLLSIIFLVCTAIITAVFEKTTSTFLVQVKTRNGLRLYLRLLLLYALFLAALFLLHFPNPISPVLSFWAQGKKGALLKISDIFIHLIVVPAVLFDLLLFLFPKLQKPFLAWKEKYNSLNCLVTYNYLFIIILVVGGLTAFTSLAPNIDIHNIEDSFSKVNKLRNFYARIRHTLGDQIFDMTLAERDNWFLFTGENSLDDYQNTQPFTTENLADIQAKLDHLSDYLTKRNIKLLVIVPPNKNTIYPQYMPSQIPVIGSQSRLDQLITYEENHGKVKVMDFRADILKASTKHQTYFPCGTHWNDFGTFIAYQGIIDSLEIYYPQLKSHSLDEYDIVKGPGENSLADYLSPNLECSTTTLVPKFDHQVSIEQTWSPTGDTSKNYFTQNSRITTLNEDSSLPRLLMYRDSFTTTLIPFLSDHFSYAAYLWAYPTDELYYDVAIEKPDVVIIEFTERHLKYLKKILIHDDQ
jgi:hypothetical protein